MALRPPIMNRIQPGPMLFVTSAEKYRSEAEGWLSRAARYPEDCWDRERLIVAARLNRALADRIERSRRPAGERQLSCSFDRPARLREALQPTSVEKAGLPAVTRRGRPRNAGNASSS